MRELICLAVFVIVSAILAIVSVLLGFLCQYKKKSQIKNTIYECGALPVNDAKVKFDIRYFNYAILFLIFDVATVFLYPFAVAENLLGIFAIIETFIFMSLLLFGLFFVAKKKMLRWL